MILLGAFPCCQEICAECNQVLRICTSVFSVDLEQGRSRRRRRHEVCCDDHVPYSDILNG